VKRPPPTRREDIIDALHGVDVADPYRWLEAGDSPEVAEWVAAQNAYTRQALDARPDRGRWHERLSALISLPTAMSCKVRGERLFVLERARGADQFALVVRSPDDADVPPQVVLDPASWAADAAMAIDWYEPNADGSMVAVGLSEGGTENSVLHLVDVDSGRMGNLRIPNTRAASVAWRPDSSGFWYACYPEGDQYSRHIRYHTLGTDPAGDPVVFDRLPNPESWPEVDASPDGAHVLVEMLVGWGRIDAHLLDVATGEWRIVIEGVEAQSSFQFGGDGLIGLTTLDAPNGRVVTASLIEPGTQHWRTVVPERTGAILGRVAVIDDDVLVPVGRAAVDSLERWSMAGEVIEVIDDLGVVAIQQMSAQRHRRRVFAVVSSFESPTAIWRYNGSDIERWCPSLASADELPALVVERVAYPSLDGTEIGLFIIRRRDVAPGANVPLVLNGYGGFALSESPAWTPNVAAWCAAGGVWAIAGLRGGFEHGERWHHAGRRRDKQNVFDDFHSAGDWLVSREQASNERLGLVGGSNGGLLVGAALTQRPDLARAVWCAVPLLDMIRFPQFLIARLWTDEYGDPEVPDEFAWLHAYSPYHRVKPGVTYPATLFSTAEGDTRVDPLHARKMAALLQAVTDDHEKRPVLLSQAGRAGHGVGKPATMRIAEGVDVLSFLAWQLGLDAD
jgi:prolyl oligopeptidase